MLGSPVRVRAARSGLRPVPARNDGAPDARRSAPISVTGQDVPDFLKTIQIAVVERWCLVQFRQLCPLHWSDREEPCHVSSGGSLLQAITKQARIPRDYGRDRRLAIAGETRRSPVGGNGCSGPPLPRVPHNISGGTLAADQGGKFAVPLDLKAFPWRFGMDGHAME